MNYIFNFFRKWKPKKKNKEPNEWAKFQDNIDKYYSLKLADYIENQLKIHGCNLFTYIKDGQLIMRIQGWYEHNSRELINISTSRSFEILMYERVPLDNFINENIETLKKQKKEWADKESENKENINF
jgi:hypothetical protein